MKTTNIPTILNKIKNLKTQFSDRKLTAEEYIDPDTGFIGIRIIDGYNTIEIVEPIYTIDEGVAVEQFSPASIIAEVETILN